MDSLRTAIDALCNASEHDLETFTAQADQGALRQAIQRLQRLVPAARASRSKTLADSLKERHEHVKNYLMQSARDVVANPPECDVDGRVTDICMLEGRRVATLQDHFRRFLAERSLAMQFNQLSPRRLDHMASKRTFELLKDRQDSMRSFARNVSKKHEDRVRVAVKVGLRYLLLEKEHGIGISCILAFFRKDVEQIEFQAVSDAVDSYSEVTQFGADFDERMRKAIELYDSQRPQIIQNQSSDGPVRKKLKTASNPLGKPYAQNED